MLKKDHLDNQDRLFLCPVPGPNLIEVLKWLWIASFPDIEMTLLDFCIFWAAYTMDTPSVTTPFNTLCLVWSTNSADWPLSNPIWAKATIHWQLTKVLQRSQTMTSLGATRICSSLKAVFHKVAIRAACSRLTAWRFVGCNVVDSCHYLVEGSSSCYVSSLILKTLQDFSSSVTVVLLPSHSQAFATGWTANSWLPSLAGWSGQSGAPDIAVPVGLLSYCGKTMENTSESLIYKQTFICILIDACRITTHSYRSESSAIWLAILRSHWSHLFHQLYHLRISTGLA